MQATTKPGVLDDVWIKRCAELGVLVRYYDDFVVLCVGRPSAA